MVHGCRGDSIDRVRVLHVDDGPGVAEADRERVFDQGNSTSEDGIGPGLSIGREVVSVHGWSIAVTAGAAVGARFEVTGVDLVE